MTSLKTSIKTITYLSDIGCLEIQGASLQGKQIAEIVFVPTGENLAIIEHTDVDESLKGQGIGKQLVAKVVEKMRREKRKIIPLCPFAKHEFDKTREYDDIRS
ncbi:GNAT family N-acetyltransferase [Escherichia coli]|nr:GNAT family N-acetyltransferase [Escherichia coli]